ncbi:MULTISPECIES: tape measure protein [Bacteria]|uniref:phage tail protein n=1 Tax=Bacteria TaxID=2 RepID=UPI003C7DF4EA
MAQNLGYATLSIIPSAKGFGKTLSKDVDGQMLEAGRRGGASLMSGMAAPLAKLAAGIGGAIVGYAGLKAVIGGGLARQMQIENATAKLTGLGHSADAVKGIMDNALASVKGTAFGLGEAASVAASMVASGIAPGEQLTGVLKTVADTATIAGLDFQSMGAIFGSVAARGKLQGDDLLQLTSRGVPVLQFLGKQLGKTSAEISEMVSKGQIDFETFNAAMAANIGGAALASGNTTEGALANMRAAFSRLGATLTGGIFPLFKEFFNVVTSVTDSIQSRLEKTLGPLGQRIQSAINPPLQALRTQIPAVLDLLVSGDLSSKTRDALRLQEGDVPVGVILGLREAFLGLGRVVKDTLAPIGDGIRAVFDALGSSAKTALPLLSPVGALASLLGAALPIVGEALGSVLTAIAPSLPALAAAMASLVSAAADLLAALLPLAGSVLAGIAAAVAAIVPPVVQAVAAVIGWVVANRDWLGALAAVGGVIGGVVLAIAGFRAVQTALIAVTYGAQGAMLVAGAAAKVYGAIQTVVSNATKIAAAAQAVFNAVMNANPIVLVITAITALVAGLIWFFTQTDVGRAIWEGFMKWLGEAWANIVNVATAIWTGLSDFFVGLWTGISDFFIGVWTAISDFLKPVFDVIGGMIRFYVEAWVNVFLIAAAALKVIWDGIVAAVTWAWNLIASLVSPIVEAVASAITTTFQAVAEWWNGIWSGISSFFTDIWNGLVAFLTPILLQVGEFVMGTVRNIQAVWNSVWGAVADFFSGIWNAITGAVQNGVNAVMGVIGGIYGRIMSVIGGIGNWLVSAGGDLIRGFWNGISDMVGWLMDRIADTFNGVVDWAKSILGIKSPSRVFKGLGAFVGEGFALGIESMTGRVESATEDMANSAINAADGTHLALTADVSKAIPRGGLTGSIDRQTEALRGDQDRDYSGPDIHVHTNDPELAAGVVADRLRRR